jgi:hypothetical protein
VCLLARHEIIRLLPLPTNPPGPWLLRVTGHSETRTGFRVKTPSGRRPHSLT